MQPAEYFDQDRRNMAPLLPRKARRVLEVGCGSGSFLDFARVTLAADDAWGVEPQDAAAALARDRGLSVITGTFPEATLELTGAFDAIIFNDVLEHMVDPWSALRAASELLEFGGSVIVSLPNIANLSTVVQIVKHGDFRYQEHGVLDRTHLRFFTRKSAERMFRECGFAVEAFVPISPLGGRRLRRAARLIAACPGVGATELGFVQLAFRLTRSAGR